MNNRRLVQQAHNQQQAMLVLADALDRIETALAVLAAQPAGAADPWSEWAITPEEALTVGVDLTVRDVQAATNNQREIDDLNEALRLQDDPEERRALEAKLRLLQDTGTSDTAPNEGLRVKSTTGEGEITVDIPAASPERQHLRRSEAVARNYESFLEVPMEGFLDAYAKGGPMWLYLGDRDAIMAMPYEWRLEMVNDIEQDSPRQAQEVARDILKNTGAGSSDEAKARGAGF